MANSAGLWNEITSYSRYIITSHIRPDPDAVGSEIALALFLGKLGKESRIVNEGPLPEAFTFLPRSELVLAYPEGTDFDYEAIICLDAPDLERTGLGPASSARAVHPGGAGPGEPPEAEADDHDAHAAAGGSGLRSVPVIIVDHHPYENRLADFAWIDPKVSSTGELLYTFMAERPDLIDSDIATCLYAAIMTDTGRFTYSNTSGKTLQAAAALVSLGASPSRIAQGYYENISDAQMYLLGRAATAMKRAAGGAVAYTTLSQEDFDRAGAGPEAAQELAELPRRLEGVRIGALIREAGGGIKVSLRSKGDTDIRAVAEHFGGGGHRAAAGFFLELPLAEAEILVIRFLEEYLTNKHR